MVLSLSCLVLPVAIWGTTAEETKVCSELRCQQRDGHSPSLSGLWALMGKSPQSQIHASRYPYFSLQPLPTGRKEDRGVGVRKRKNVTRARKGKLWEKVKTFNSVRVGESRWRQESQGGGERL